MQKRFFAKKGIVKIYPSAALLRLLSHEFLNSVGQPFMWYHSEFVSLTKLVIPWTPWKKYWFSHFEPKKNRCMRRRSGFSQRWPWGRGISTQSHGTIPTKHGWRKESMFWRCRRVSFWIDWEKIIEKTLSNNYYNVIVDNFAGEGRVQPQWYSTTKVT